MPDRSSTQGWVDKLEIRELIERSVRHIDDGAGDRLAQLFVEDGVLQLAGTVFEGRSALRNMFGGMDPRAWTEPGELLKQPGSTHLTSNPIIDVDGDTATAESDMVTVVRDESGRARITLVARYRARLRRSSNGWLIASRTGVSIARPGEAGTAAEWSRALAAMSNDVRSRFRADG
jgi:hypothetical protein